MIQKAYIYKVTNKYNNKVYIGITRDRSVTLRWNEHLYSNSKLNKDIQIYGIEAFIFETIETLNNITNEILFAREKHWISKYDSTTNGYNVISNPKGRQLTYSDVSETVAKGLKDFQEIMYLGSFAKSSNNKLSFWKLLQSQDMNILTLLMKDNYVTRKTGKYHQALIDSFKTRRQRFFEIEEFGEKYATDNIESIIDFLGALKASSLSSVEKVEAYDKKLIVYCNKGERRTRFSLSCILLYSEEVNLHTEIDSIFDMLY